MRLRPLAPSVVSLLLIGLLLLNIADSVCTVIAVMSNVAKEVNPLMNWLLNQGPVAFLVFKLIIGPVIVIPMWVLRWHKLAMYGALGAVTLYFLVCVSHLYGLLTTGIIPGIGPV